MKIAANELEFDLLFSAVMRIMDEDGRGFLRNQKVMWETTDMTWTERCKRTLLYASRLWAHVRRFNDGTVICDVLASDSEPKVGSHIEPSIALNNPSNSLVDEEIQYLEFHFDEDLPKAEIDL
jgi:hypothetical protein